MFGASHGAIGLTLQRTISTGHEMFPVLRDRRKRSHPRTRIPLPVLNTYEYLAIENQKIRNNPPVSHELKTPSNISR